jgi:hypothetical protein
MKYALLVYLDPDARAGRSESEQQAISAQYMDISQDPRVIGGEQLADVQTATTVRTEDGHALTTDGPFADTKEILGGFYLLEADDLDKAIEVASRVPTTWMGGSVEIRPVVELPS